MGGMRVVREDIMSVKGDEERVRGSACEVFVSGWSTDLLFGSHLLVSGLFG
jgi:hypothetical protein